jgi:hypothetical protein
MARVRFSGPEWSYFAKTKKIYCCYCPCAVATDGRLQKKNLLAGIIPIPPQRDLPISWNIAPTPELSKKQTLMLQGD